MQIWKYPLLTQDEQVVTIPEGAITMTVQVQRGTPCLWAMVAPGADPEDRTIYTRGTGHDVGKDPDTLVYLGTYQLDGGALVFHVFTDRR